MDTFTVRCWVADCGWAEEWSVEVAAMAAASWHVHDHHPILWLQIIGERPPRDAKPETLGKRVT